jgi:hypothetical protein
MVCKQSTATVLAGRQAGTGGRTANSLELHSLIDNGLCVQSKAILLPVHAFVDFGTDDLFHQVLWVCAPDGCRIRICAVGHRKVDNGKKSQGSDIRSPTFTKAHPSRSDAISTPSSWHKWVNNM